MLSISEIKTGRNIILNNEPFSVVYHEHSKMGRAGAVLRTKLKNLTTGAMVEKTFQGAETVEEANITQSPAQYLYKEGDDGYVFMDMESYDQFTLTKEALADITNYLTEGTEVTVLLWNDNPINITLPIKVILEVTEAPPNIKGDTASGATKQVTLQTGLVITVPMFISSGDKILINTERGEYVSKA
ncbi:MAG: elongation factor P [Candidatus Moranbacteria bacterium]|nr:elongation factor P [Candidatus Moranbacteria bacterium]